MTTKAEDAISIVGPELFAEAEKHLASDVKLKSEIETLIEKASTEEDSAIEKAEKLKAPHVLPTEDNLQNLLPAQPYNKFRVMLSKMLDDGEIEDDETAETLNAMLDWLSGYMASKSTTEEIKIEEVTKSTESLDVTKTEVEKCDEYSELPLGGSKSLMQAKLYLDTQKIEYNIGKVYHMFMSVVENIMVDKFTDLGTKIALIQNALEEFKSVLTPEVLVTLSEKEKDETVVVDPTVKELSETVKLLSEKVDSIIKSQTATVEEKSETTSEEKVEQTPSLIQNLEVAFKSAVTLDGNNRKDAFQNIINTLAQELFEIDKSLTKPVNQTQPSGEFDPTQFKSEVVNEVNQIVGNQINLLSEQLTQQMKSLTASLGANQFGVSRQIQPTQMEIPQAKSFQPTPNVMRTQTSVPREGLSIAEIVRRTTVGDVR